MLLTEFYRCQVEYNPHMFHMTSPVDLRHKIHSTVAQLQLTRKQVKSLNVMMTEVSKMHCTNERRVRKRDKKVRRDVI